MKLSVKKVI
uniref:Uncharacterized protein n=1 Tax=Anguilla anguilla TaxID=7936 RepID=A0A0E9SPK5_ANGAN